VEGESTFGKTLRENLGPAFVWAWMLKRTAFGKAFSTSAENF
jgi:hypothetical protein